MSKVKRLASSLAAFAMIASVSMGVKSEAKAGMGYEAEFAGQSNANSTGGHSLTIGQGETATVYIQYKNVGANTWYKGQVNLGPVHSNGAIERTPLFDSVNWFSPNNGGNLRPATLTEDMVAPGEVGTFEFELFADPGQIGPGDYKLYFAPVAEGVSWFGNHIGVNFDVRVTPAYSSKWVSQSHRQVDESHTIEIVRGEEETAWVKLKNTGTLTWNTVPNGGIVKVGASNPRDRMSMFKGSDWVNDNRLSDVDVTTAPGQEGVFTFNFYAPTEAENAGVDDNENYQEYIQPVAEYLYWMEDQGIFWNILVRPETYAPRVQYAKAIDLTHVELKFNKKVDEALAEDLVNYQVWAALSGGASYDTTIISAVLGSDERTVILTLDAGTPLQDRVFTAEVVDVTDTDSVAMEGNLSSATFQGLGGFVRPMVNSAVYDADTYTLELTMNKSVYSDDAEVVEAGLTLSNGSATVMLTEGDYADDGADDVTVTMELDPATGVQVSGMTGTLTMDVMADSFKSTPDDLLNREQLDVPVTVVRRPYVTSASYDEETNMMTLGFSEPTYGFVAGDLANFEVTIEGTTNMTADGATSEALVGTLVSGVDGDTTFVFEITNATDIEIGDFESGYLEVVVGSLFDDVDGNMNLPQYDGNQTAGTGTDGRDDGFREEVELSYIDDITPPTVESSRYNASYATVSATGGILRVVFSEPMGDINWDRFELKLNGESLGTLDTVSGPTMALDQDYAYEFTITNTDPVTTIAEEEVEAFRPGDELKLVYTTDGVTDPGYDEAFLVLADGATVVDYYDTMAPANLHVDSFLPLPLNQSSLSVLAMGSSTPGYTYFGAGVQVAKVIDSDASYDWILVQFVDYSNALDEVTTASAENVNNYKVYTYGSTEKVTPMSAMLLDDGQSVILKTTRPTNGFPEDSIVVVEASNIVDGYGNDMSDAGNNTGFGFTKADLLYNFTEDTTAPEVTLDPVFEAVEGENNDEIYFEMTETDGVIDDSTLTLSNMTLYEGTDDTGTAIAWGSAVLSYIRVGDVYQITIDMNDDTFMVNDDGTEDPAFGLASDYYMEITNVADYPAGNVMTDYMYTDTAMGDYCVSGDCATDPTVFAYATNVGEYDVVEVYFNEKMDQTSAEDESNYDVDGMTPVSAVYSYDSTTERTMVTLSFTDGDLVENTDVTVSVNGVVDLANNTSDFSAVVTVGDLRDPTIIEDGFVAVAVMNAADSHDYHGMACPADEDDFYGADYFEVSYSEAMKLGDNYPGGVNNYDNYTLTVGGQSVSLNDSRVTVDMNNTDATETFTCLDDLAAHTIRFYFDSDSDTYRVNMQFGDSATLEVANVEDASGNVIAPVTVITNVTGDDTLPAFEGILEINTDQDDGGRGLKVYFDEDVKVSEVMASSFTLYEGTDDTGVEINITDVSYNAANGENYDWVVLNTSAEPTASDYYVEMTVDGGVEDLAGNAMATATVTDTV